MSYYADVAGIQLADEFCSELQALNSTQSARVTFAEPTSTDFRITSSFELCTTMCASLSYVIISVIRHSARDVASVSMMDAHASRNPSDVS